MAANPRFRFLYVVWGFLECLLFGGLLYGWASLVFVLKEDGVYSDVCNEQSEPQNNSITSDITSLVVVGSSTVPSVTYSIGNGSHGSSVLEQEDASRLNPNCPDRDKLLTLVFTIGSMMFCAGCAVMGLLNFKFGTRVTRLCALACYTVGALLTGFTSHDLPWLIFPGLSLLGIGGIPLLMTNTQFSMLFSRGSSTVISVMSGGFDASSGVMLIVKLAHERGVALRWSMLVITCLHLVTLVSTFFFLPRGFISKATPESVQAVVMQNQTSVELLKRTYHTDEDPESKKEARTDEVKGKGKKLPSVISCIISPVYFLHVIWLSILQLRFYYFLGSLNAWLTGLLGSNEEVSYFTNVCQYAMMCGLITSPVAGIIYDIHKRIFAHSRSQLRCDLMPSVIPLALTSLLGITLSVLVLFHSSSILYPAFIINTIFRSFIYSMGASYIGVMFPSEYFGILYGLMIILSGFISLFQYGFFSWAEASGFTSVNGFLIVFMATSLVHPLYQWFTCHRAECQVNLED